ncbi:short-chain dehydrogenase/reductase SDR [Halodesulfurarchaeum formicicum]|uniref:Short-chain dehydrogenase/reductase SDR n=1 Tax=Halodesulfurarchaeum formicicum TaxID=1873524 RepID=A0A1D8S272_9EURY|nr:short-chain dehydrogenase/reductase SDR [Halodesulfurarchaeum formicicum]APE94684.1 short-chain dehydrogenase/reductase SDR [Halodesulfurarchaeum formicicum]
MTGAARGVGRKTAERYAEAGADVIVTDICSEISTLPYDLGTRADLERTADLVRDTGSEALVIPVDVRDASAVRDAVETGVDRFGHIDFLAANAGVWDSRPFADVDEALFELVIDTNLKGAWLSAKYIARQAIQHEKQASIVITSSILGQVGAAWSAHYSASKHGIIGFTKSLALELGEYGIRANVVSPTGIDTPMVEKMVESLGTEPFDRISGPVGPMNLLDGNLLDPQDVAEAHLWLASDASGAVTGAVLPIDAGMTAK